MNDYHAEAPPPLSGMALVLTSIALALGAFMQVLDATIANVALPTISGNLGVSSANGIWVITSFACANGVTVPLTGWLMMRLGVVRTFIASITAFTIASLLCGMAWSLSSLIVFRLLQGAVSGPMIPGSQALLLSIYPEHKRGTALSIWSTTALVAPVLGPLLGGYICENYHWGWIFLINVPVGFFTAAVTWNIMRRRETATKRQPIDLVGLALLVFWVFCLQTMLDLGKDRDWFHSDLIVFLAFCASVALAAWIIWELTDSHPIVDLSLFRHRNFTLGVIALCLGYASLFGGNLLLPEWLQSNMGYTASWAGAVSAPAGLVAILITPLIGRYLMKIDARISASIAFAIYGVSYLLRTRFPPDASFEVLVFPILLQGFGMSMFFVPLLTIVLDGIPAARVPSASGISNFLRITAGSFAASVTTTFWDRREAFHQSRLVEASSPFSRVWQSAITSLTAHGMTVPQAQETLMQTVIRQAYLLSTIDLFWVTCWICILVIGAVWLTKRPMPSDHANAAD
jgi:MFS transporter, DHA2 family, multidrug resistance protein